MALTLVQFWQQERDTYEAMQTAAQNDLAAAQLALTTAKATLDTDVAALNVLVAGIAANRAQLATTSVPSQVTAVNNTIRDQIIQQRAAQGSILDDQEAVATAQSDTDAASATLKRATAGIADSGARLTAAQDANLQRQLLKAQLAAPPFDTIKADATAATAGPAATDAKAEIDANFPAALQTIAAKRYATRFARAAQLRDAVIAAETALGATLAAASGLSGAAAEKGTDFSHANQALRDYATTAKQRYDHAIGVLADLQGMKKGTKKPDLLSVQEKLDVASNNTRNTAEKNAETLDADRNLVYTARQDLDAQVVAQIGTDVDALATDPALKTKRDAVTARVAALKAAEAAFVATPDKKVLDEWQVVVVDSAWGALIGYLDATAALLDLKNIDPAALGTTLDTAEDAYATALAAAAKAQRQSDALTDAISLRAARVDASSAAFPGRLLSAVRGDSF